jgi:hypothetical protein
VASAIGLAGPQLPLTELFWGVRRFLEILAGERPLVVVIDDIHWAEPTFLDLLEHLTDSLAGARVLILATARHDLLEARPAWGQGTCTTRILLEGLTEEQTGAVVDNLLGDAGLPRALRERITRASGGNPLFVEQMLSMLIDDGLIRAGDGGWHVVGELGSLAVPPTIHALLAARLDRLVRDERTVLEPAAVIGVEFPTPAVTELAPPAIHHQVGALLDSMTGKQLVRPTGSVVVGYRFNHQLIRDTTYQAMLKRGRALLHERYADWLTEHESDRIGEVEEVIGYHLEQAYLARRDLGPLDDQGRELGARAATLLADSGRRAFDREDMRAAVSLMRRAVALLQDDSQERRGAQLLLAEALDETGAFGEARDLLGSVEAAAVNQGDERSACRARLLELRLELGSSPGPNWAARALDEANRAAEIFEAEGDPAGASLAWRVRYAAHGTTGALEEAAADAERVIAFAREANDERQRLRGLSNLAIALTYGPTPADEAAERLGALAGEVGSDRATGAVIAAATAQLMAMGRQYDSARELYRRAQETAHDLGQPVLAAQLALDAAEVEVRAGDPVAVEAVLGEAAAVLAAADETFILASISSMRGRAFLELGRTAEAAEEAQNASSMAADDDLDAQSRSRGLRSAILLAAGDAQAAAALARESVDLARAADVPMVTALALGDLAAALQASGDAAGGAAARDEALAIYARKGDLASADRLRTLSLAP